MTPSSPIARLNPYAIVDNVESIPSSNREFFQFHESYTNTLDALRKHIVGMSNPFLRKEIQSKLGEIATGMINVSEGIHAAFNGLSIPIDTMELIIELSRQIREEARQHSESMGRVESLIKSDLLNLSTQKGVDALPSWEELDYFLQRPQVKRLKDADIKKIFFSILREDFYHLQDIIKVVLDKDFYEIDKQLASTDYEDFNTLIGEIINQKPKKNEGLYFHWNQPDAFFKDKTLHLTNPQNTQIHIGTILECRTDSSGGKIFRLHDESEVHVSNSFQVSVTKKYSYRIWNALQNGILTKEVYFDICTPNDRHVVTDIPAGTYRIKEANTHTSKFTGNHKNTFLLIEKTKNEEYRITAYYKNTNDTNPHIILAEVHEGESTKLRDLTLAEFNSNYRAVTKQKEQFDEINTTNIEKHILVKDEKNQNTIKLRHLEDIKLKTDALRKDFLSSEN
jgi:hypothetical protein